MRDRIAASITAVSLLFWVSTAGASSPWFGERGDLEVSTGFLYETFETFYRGADRTDFPFDHFNQVTTVISVDYVFYDRLAFDMTLGYVRASIGKNAGGSSLGANDGMQDVNFGLRYQLLDEFRWDSPWVPTVAFRFGGIIAGTYSTADTGVDFPGIPGDGASGFESEFSVGKVGLPLEIGLIGAIGIRWRDQNVPFEWHLRLGAFRTFYDRVTLSFAYDQWHATSGLDIGGPGFTAARFRELKEVSNNVETSIGYSDLKGRYFGFYYIKTVGGRNTGRKDSFGVSISAPFSFLGGE